MMDKFDHELAIGSIAGIKKIPDFTNTRMDTSARKRVELHCHTKMSDMDGAYHHITVLGKENEPCDHKYDVTGSLCENNDKFAIDRMLPKIDIGDYIAIHDTGAHGFAMGYNYNGKLKSAELLLKEDGSVELIRRAETPKDYFATFDCFDIYNKINFDA